MTTIRDVQDDVMPALASLTGCDVAIYHHVNLRQGTETVLAWPPDVFSGEALARYSATMTTHPLIQHYAAREDDTGSRRISDLVTTSDWHSRPVYAECHRSLGIEDQLVLPLVRRQAVSTGFSLCRSRTISDETVDLACLLNRHLQAAMVRGAGKLDRVRPAWEVSPRFLPSRLPPPPDATPVWEVLTARQTRVLELLAEGWSTRQMATRLELAEGTVNKHIERIYANLGVRSRAAATREYVRGTG